MTLLKWIVAGIVFFAALLIGHHNATASVTAMALAAPGVAIVRSTDTGFTGWAVPGEPKIWLSPMAYREAVRGDGVGMLIFLHEVGHTTGLGGERDANCYALHRMRTVLRTFYGFTRKHAQQSYRDALAFQRVNQPELYRCAL